MKKKKDNFLNPPKSRNVHFVWHRFCKYFEDSKSDEFPPPYKWKGYALMCKIRKFVKKYPQDIRILRCDDDYHAGSILVTILHRSKYDFMGTTVIFVPQCTGESPIRFFLYPGHDTDMIKELTRITKIQKRYPKDE